MFENLIRELNSMGNEVVVPVSLGTDAEGYLDRECPAESCFFPFKVLGEDWLKIDAMDHAHCPMCRHTAPANHWSTKAQVEGAQQQALAAISGRLNQAMRTDARRHNAQQGSDSSISMTIEVKGRHNLPLESVAASEPMRLRATCEACGCRYSYIGSAFFCPSCGHNSASATFVQSIGNARRAAAIKAELMAKHDRDTAEVLARLLREKATADIVTSVQRLAERVWETLPAPKPTAPANVFQRLDDASALWLSTTGKDFGSFLPTADFDRLKVYYQRRHLLSHSEGIVDTKYLQKTGDTTFALGQRITVDEGSVIEFTDLAERLGLALLGFMPNAISPPASAPAPALVVSNPVPARRRHGMSTEAEAIARFVVENSEQGLAMDPQVSPDALRKATGLPDDEIVEAADELERAGLVTLHTALGMERIGFYSMTPLTGLFEVFDPVFGIGDPVADAKVVGSVILQKEGEGISSDEIAKVLSWSPRRLNPAVAVLDGQDLVMTSRALDMTWFSSWVRPKPGLRRFVRS